MLGIQKTNWQKRRHGTSGCARTRSARPTGIHGKLYIACQRATDNVGWLARPRVRKGYCHLIFFIRHKSTALSEAAGGHMAGQAGRQASIRAERELIGSGRRGRRTLDAGHRCATTINEIYSICTVAPVCKNSHTNTKVCRRAF